MRYILSALLLLSLTGCATERMPTVEVIMFQPDAITRSTIEFIPCDQFSNAHMQVWRDVVKLKYAASDENNMYGYWFWFQVQRALSSGLIKDTHECLKNIPSFRKDQ